MTEVASPAPADGLSRADEADIERFETELEVRGSVTERPARELTR